MLRLLLSFLALVSGLAAMAPETDARAFAARPAIAATMQGAGAARVSAHVVAHAREITRPAQPRLIEAARAPLRMAYSAPAVRMRVDRSRE